MRPEAMFVLDYIRLSQWAVVEILLALKTQKAMTQVVYREEEIAVTFCTNFTKSGFQLTARKNWGSGYSASENEFSVLGNQLGTLPWKRQILPFSAVISCL